VKYALILFVTIIVLETTTVSRVVKKCAISLFCLAHKLSKSAEDIVIRGVLVGSVILQIKEIEVWQVFRIMYEGKYST